ncbi:conserved hypothetical protein [Talaromyces stipitatus ATCC 10500]|uniref:BTB domain-containing protein n=1 Tax=Talaromyces stipitatus (strain ATCC 10500 / CBS 375.48 / QM 6759 / NRRL 1006) TaxID=441959 RepID=B8MGQ4_TALSN|nr:uncharacterized protein TSTA_018720 [Talaromyces stipitatus ATCC 10500]EED16805.1 conserved hypothetical protein [Talaromyces stipitatus ATCC 10500]
MFVKKSSHGRSESFTSKYRAGKSTSTSTSRSMKRSFREHAAGGHSSESRHGKHSSPLAEQNLTSAVVTICVGQDQRLFAAHEDVLSLSPFFAACCRGQFLQAHNKQISLPDERPEVLSSVLEYLYKGDYYPRLIHNKRRDTWLLEDDMMDIDGGDGKDAAYLHQEDGSIILKDTAMYCAAERYKLPELKRLALRKQGLQSGIHCSTILTSARYAYANTPETDSQLRAHYLALIIRSRSTFKRSGTMQMEMEKGGKVFFDLFVAMCNHMDDIATASPTLSRKT